MVDSLLQRSGQVGLLVGGALYVDITPKARNSLYGVSGSPARAHHGLLLKANAVVDVLALGQFRRQPGSLFPVARRAESRPLVLSCPQEQVALRLFSEENSKEDLGGHFAGNPGVWPCRTI